MHAYAAKAFTREYIDYISKGQSAVMASTVMYARETFHRLHHSTITVVEVCVCPTAVRSLFYVVQSLSLISCPCKKTMHSPAQVHLCFCGAGLYTEILG
jgi:hypothetical protein